MTDPATLKNDTQRKYKQRLIYEARKNGVTVATGTADELAEVLHTGHSTIGNCERTGRKIHGEYEIERREEK